MQLVEVRAPEPNAGRPEAEYSWDGRSEAEANSAAQAVAAVSSVALVAAGRLVRNGQRR